MPAREPLAIPDSTWRWLIAATALAAFAPLLRGRFLLGGTDVQFTHYPNLLFGHEMFGRWGELPLWNPRIFAGFDMTASMHAHYLNPLYWPIMLLPREDFLAGVTALFFACNLTVGFVWFALAKREGATDPGAAIVALVAQAGMFFWFAATTMIAIPMYAAASAAILLIRTADRRSPLAQYLLLSAALAAIAVTPHPSYLIGFAAPIVAAFLLPGEAPRRWLPAIAASATAIAVCAFRLYPVAYEIANSGGAVALRVLPASLFNVYYILTAWVPTALGVELGESIRISDAIGQVTGIRHTQSHNALYFGVATSALAIGLWRGLDARTRWASGAAVSVSVLTPIYFFAPLSDLMAILTQPLFHEAMYRIGSNFAFLCLLTVGVARARAWDEAGFRWLRRAVLAVCVLAALMLLALWYRALFADPNALHAVGRSGLAWSFRVAAIGVLLAGYFWIREESGRYDLAAAALAASLFAVPLIYVGSVHLPQPYDPSGLAAIVDAGTTAALAAVVVVVRRLAPRAAFAVAMTAAVALFTAGQASLPEGPNVGNPQLISFGLALLGLGKALLVAMVALTILRPRPGGAVDFARALPLLFALAWGDLLGAYRTYSYVNTPTPFPRAIEAVFPARDPAAIIGGASALAAPSRVGLPELLADSRFERPPNAPRGAWQFGGEELRVCEAAQGKNGLRVCAALEGRGDPNLFQDLTAPHDTRTVVFGIWLRVPPGGRGRIFITSPSANIGSDFAVAPADDAWHWVNVALDLPGAGPHTLRSHVNFARGDAGVRVFAPRVVAASSVGPSEYPDGAGRSLPDISVYRFDPKIHRVNEVHQVLRLSGHELVTSSHSIYGVRSYSGVDSDLPKDYVAFVAGFFPRGSSAVSLAGIAASMTDPRGLDLLGVAFGAHAGAPARPDAIPRLALFEAAEEVADQGAAQRRVRDLTFDHTRKLAIEGAPPELPSSPAPGRMRALDYDETGANRISARLRAEDPRLVFFGDRFAPGWRATWNGAPLPILRANAVFMAMALPQGEGRLELAFQPPRFMIGTRVSLVALALWAAALLFWAVQRRRARR
jgi:hypothetical protein